MSGISTPSPTVSQEAALQGFKAPVTDRLALYAASRPYLCADRCDAELPDWPTAVDYILTELLKSGAIPPELKSFTFASGDNGSTTEPADSPTQYFDMGGHVAALIKALVANLFAEKGHLDREKICGCGGKDGATAEKLKVRGNELFTDRQYLLAVKFYSAAQVTGGPSEKTIAFLRSNRSAALLRMEQYENALSDIAASFRLNIPADKAGKVLIRQAECLRALGRTQELAALFGQASLPAVFTEAEKRKWAELKRLPPVAKETVAPSMGDLGRTLKVAAVVESLTAMGRFARRPEGQPFPWLSAKVQLVREADSGKFRLIATEAISAGEIVAVVKPHATIPLNESTSNNTVQHGLFERCHHCTGSIYRSADYFERLPSMSTQQQQQPPPKFIRIHNPVACLRCSAVFFCSDDCYLEAWNTYHRFECGHLPVLRCLGAEAHLALRSLYATGGPQAVTALFQEEEAEEKEVVNQGQGQKLNECDPIPPQCARLDVLDEEYRRVYYTALQLATDNESKYRSMIANHLLLNLATYSGFLEYENNGNYVAAGWALFRQLNLLKRHCLVVSRPNHTALSRSNAHHRFLLATGLLGVVEPAPTKEAASLALHFANPLQIVCSNVLLATACRPMAAGERLSMDLTSGSFETAAGAAAPEVPINDFDFLAGGALRQ